MIQQKKLIPSDILEAINFPKSGEVIGGIKILKAEANVDGYNISYEILLPKGTKSKAVPKVLRQFFSTQIVPTTGNIVVTHHDYTVSPKNGNVCVQGNIQLESVVRMNPGLQEFDEEYASMEMTQPETYFKKHPYKGFNSPPFRAKLFSMVSYMGENYGYCDGSHIYHRRASLIMPKIKITKAVPKAKMMYHTHPKKDEPSLSSADDYLIYMDLSHAPRSIRHFCTVMEDRMDCFQIQPKKGSKQNFLKLNEDKIIEEIDAKISALEKKWDAKMPKEDATKDDNLRYCENITRDLVKWLNTHYGKYFSFKYQCHYKVKKNPPEPTADDLHLKEELLQKAISDTRTKTYSWPQFDTQKMPHENYAYWHQMYYTEHVKDSFMTLGVKLKGAQDRRYSQYMSKSFEESTYTNLDALNMLNLSYDIAAQDAIIRDGNGFTSRMADLCEYMQLSEEACETLTLLEQVIHQEAMPSEQARTLCGDYYPLALLSYYSISAIHTIAKVQSGEVSPDKARYDIYSKLKQEISEALSSFLAEHESLFQQGFVDSYMNPPPMRLQRTDYLVSLPPEAFDLYDIAAEALTPFSKSRIDPKRPFFTEKSKFNLWVQTKGGRVGMMISQRTGSVEVTATTENPMEDAMEAVDKVGQALYRAGLPVNPTDFGLMLNEGAMNPQRAQVIILCGPSGSGKSTTLRNLLKVLPNARTAPTITTRRKRRSDKPDERMFVGKGEFLHMVSQGDLVAVQLQRSGDYYAKRLSDFEKEGYVVIEVSLKGLNQMKNIFPNAFTVYLEPVDDPEMIRKRLLRRGDISAKDARARAEIVPQHIASSKKIEFDLRIPMKQGEFDYAAKEIMDTLPKDNPGFKDNFDWFEEWAKLINMKNKEIDAFMESDWFKVSGLTPGEAKEAGIRSGQNSLRAIMRMRKKLGLTGPKDYIPNGPRIIESYYEKALNNWTKDDWEWCKHQVRFNKRAGAFPYNPTAEERKGPLVKVMKTYARPSRKLLSLWVWGHDPWRWARKNGFEGMSPCPNVPWIGMTEKRKWGKVEVEMSPRKKNPMAPGYNSYAWTTQDWRSIKVNNKGDIDYSEKCGAEGTKTPSGSPRLCLPAAVVKSLIRTESGKEVIRKQARKKARAKKGERVPWHPRIKKIWKRIEDKTVKDKPNPPLYVHPDKAEKWSERYEKITTMTGEELLDLANKMAEEKGLKVELETYKQDTEKLQRMRKDFPLPPKYEKLYQKFLESKTGVDIRLYRGNTLVDELGFSLIEESTKELFEYLKQRKRLPPNRAHLPFVCQVHQLKGEKRYLNFRTFFVTAATQPKNRFPISVGGGGGFEMSEGQQGKGYYGIIKTYQAGFLEANNIEAFGDGISPMRVDLYQSYGWLSAYSYKDNYPYASRAAEYYLNLHGTSKKPNKDADYFSVYRPVYSRKMPGIELSNPSEWRHGEFAEEDPFEEYF